MIANLQVLLGAISLLDNNASKNDFINTNQNNKAKLQEYKNNYTTIKDIVAKNINIDIKTQIKIFNNNLTPIPNEINYDTCFKLLKIIHTQYNLKNITEPQLPYYALMMYKWINSQSLHEIINSSIIYYEYNNKPIKVEYNKEENFNKNNPLHINILIENIISCIEKTIKFDLKNYISNYQEFLTFKGYQINLDWASFIEYGSCDKTLIELQELGFSRNIANFLKKYHLNKFLETNGVIDDFNEIDLKNSIDKKQHKNEYNEIADFLNWEKI